MLAILWLLRDGRRKTAQQLADELEVSVRTVYRLIDALCASGVPIVADPGHHGGYRILDTFKEAPLFFEPVEQQALVQAAVFAREAGYPFDDALQAAIRKLKRYANEAQRKRLERHETGFDVVYPKTDERLQRITALLEEAVSERRTIAFAYASHRGETSRRLDPYGIVFWKGSWYVVGHCHLRAAIRSFRADRIMQASLTDDGFERPDGFSAKDWLMQGLLPDVQNEGGTIEITVCGIRGALDELCQHWLFGHALIARNEKRAHFRIDAEAAFKYVPYFLLPYGRAIRVEEPAALVERMAIVTADMAEHYRVRRPEEKPAGGRLMENDEMMEADER